VQKLKNGLHVAPFELKPYYWLVSDLSGNNGAFFIRALLSKLNVDEHHVFKWRLENKFKQYQVFNHYIPGCMPETLSFSKQLNQRNGVRKIEKLFSKGFFLKATLGDASFSTRSWDKTAEFEQLSKLPNHNGKYESYMLQRKLSIKCEFRVHTFSKDIIPRLTYLVQGHKQTDHFQDAEKFLNDVLQRLPDVILQGTFIAWDIALTDDNQYYIIEANFTGFHPEYRKGFQTTGYVDNYEYGSIICAWINRFFGKKFGVYVYAIEDRLFESHPFYKSFAFYMSLFNNINIDHLTNTTMEAPLTFIIYLGEDTNRLIINLIRHCLLVDFINDYYVIFKDECFLNVRGLFVKNNQLQLWAESWFFTKDQYPLIRQLGYERRKQISCYRALRSLTDKSCVII
jgi:hypothetical protein